MKDYKVTVIIPTFNEEKNIGECLKTILNQSYKNLEVIVVDDGSLDDTLSVVQKFPVKLLRQAHQGPARARNLASKQANGDILVFMDADMTFSYNFVEELVYSIIKGVNRGTFSKEEYISNWENVWSRCWNYNQNWPKQKMIPDDYPEEGHDFRAILKDDFLRVGGFDDIGYTDTWTLAKKLGYKPKAVVGAKYFHSNPESLGEVFIQSKWVAKREYKLGVIGLLVALLRVSLPMSLLVGVYKGIKYNEFKFLIFKIVYDFGAFIGILEMAFTGKKTK